MKQHVKVILFDNAGVIVTGDHEGTYKNLANYLGKNVEEVEKAVLELSPEADIGKITSTEFHVRLMEKLGVTKDLTQLIKIHFDSYELRKGMLEFVKMLKKHYKIAMLSNFSDAFDDCDKKWGLREVFGDSLFVSHSLKMIKPNEDVYSYVLGKLEVKPAEVVFIDDKKENVEAAIRLGMKGIVFKDLPDLKRQLSFFLGKYFI